MDSDADRGHNPGLVENNAAARFSQLRTFGGGGGRGGGRRSTTRPALFGVAAVALYLLTAWLAGFWPFASETPTPAPKSPTTNPEKPVEPPPPRDDRPRREEPRRAAPNPVAPPTPAPIPSPLPAPETRREAPPTAAPTATDDLVRKADAEIGEARQSGDADRLRRALSPKVLDERYPAALRDRWLEESRNLAKRVVFSASPMAHATQVVVKDGDHYVGICQRLKKEQNLTVTPAFLERVNDIAPSKLRPKTTLKVPTEPLSLVVDKGDFRLYVVLGDAHLLDYPVGLGRDEKTPEGAFTIQWKTKNPTWTDPKSGKVLTYGEPGHIIGNRWLGFAAADGSRTGFGIHGTVEPDTIGKAMSDGCVRMRTPDVEALFELIPPGTKVVVRR